MLKILGRILGYLSLLALAVAFLFIADDIFVYREAYPAGTIRDAEQASRVIDFSGQTGKLEQEPHIEPGLKERPKPEPEPKPAPSTPGGGSGSSAVGAAGKEQQMVNLINQARADAGLPPLQVSSQLTSAARAKSRDMIENSYFSHTSPTYGSFTDLLNHFGVSFGSAAENLALNSTGSVTGAHDMLMASPGHRTNILGSRYSLVGVGIQVSSDGSHYYTQLFVGY